MGDPNAARYEHQFYLTYLSNKGRDSLKGYVPPSSKCSFSTEKRLRAFSFGLMQIMGETARSCGFRGSFLTELCDPRTNIELGTQYLKQLLDMKDGDLSKALYAYNAGPGSPYPGPDAKYPSQVLSHIGTEPVTYLLS